MNSPEHPTTVSPLSRFGDWFGEAFSLFGREWMTWCLQGLIYCILPFVPLAIGGGILVGALGFASANLNSVGGDPRATPIASPVILAGIAAFVLGFLVTLWFMSHLLVGMFRTAAKQLRGEAISVGDIFQAGGVGTVLQAFLGSLVVVVGVLVGVAFFVIPGLLVAGLFLFVHPLIVERRLSIAAALRESVRLTTPHLLGYSLWVLLVYVTQYVGSIVVCGVIATMPLAILMWMAAYRDAVGEQTPPPFSAARNIPPSEIWPRNEG